MHIEGVVIYEEDQVFDSNFIPSVCNPCDRRGANTEICRTQRANGTTSREAWAKDVSERTGKTPPKRSSSTRRRSGNGGSGSSYYEADAWIYYGIATTYSSSGKLIGTGPWEYVVPFVFCSECEFGFSDLDASAVGNRRVYTPHEIHTSVNSAKSYYPN